MSVCVQQSVCVADRTWECWRNPPSARRVQVSLLCAEVCVLAVQPSLAGTANIRINTRTPPPYKPVHTHSYMWPGKKHSQTHDQNVWKGWPRFHPVTFSQSLSDALFHTWGYSSFFTLGELDWSIFHSDPSKIWKMDTRLQIFLGNLFTVFSYLGCCTDWCGKIPKATDPEEKEKNTRLHC